MLTPRVAADDWFAQPCAPPTVPMSFSAGSDDDYYYYYDYYYYFYYYNDY